VPYSIMQLKHKIIFVTRKTVKQLHALITTRLI
jgi:hypothetical protein